MFVAPGDDVYEGMIVGENSRSGDMPVNPDEGKEAHQRPRRRRDENILLKPPRVMTLEAALEYIEEDELVEVTPAHDPPAENRTQRDRSQAVGAARR